jgi:hypothetical protein
MVNVTFTTLLQLALALDTHPCSLLAYDAE